MFSIANLLDRAKDKAGIETDYRLGKVIGISHQVISGYRAGKSMPSEKILEQICALSGDDSDIVAAQIQAERSQTPEAKNLWLRVAARMSGAVTPAILAVCFAISLIAGGASDARASGLNAYKNSSTQEFIHRINWTFWPVYGFLLVRLRQFQGLFRLWMCCNL